MQVFGPPEKRNKSKLIISDGSHLHLFQVLYAQKLESACKPKHILISKSMKVALCGNREFRIREAKNVEVVSVFLKKE